MDPEASHEQEQPSELLSGWARSLAAKADRARLALSPWVQRMVDAGAPAAQPLSASVQPRATAFSEGDTRSLVERVSRKTEQSRVWHPDVGSVSPATFDRFAGEIVQRFRPMADKYQVASPEEGAAEESDLTLAPATQSISMLNVGIGPAERGLPRPGMPPAPSPGPAATEQQAALPPTATDAPRPVARAVTRTVQRRPGVRPMSRVQEITPGGTAPSTAGMEPPAPADAPTESPSDAGAAIEDKVPSEQPVEGAAVGETAVLSTDAPLQRAPEPSAEAETGPPEPRAEMQPDTVERRAQRPSPRPEATDRPVETPLSTTPGDLAEEPVRRQTLDATRLAGTPEESELPRSEVAAAEVSPLRAEPAPPSSTEEAPARGLDELAPPGPAPHPELGPASPSETPPLQRKADEAASPRAGEVPSPKAGAVPPARADEAPPSRVGEAPQPAAEAALPSGMDLALPELEAPAVEIEQQAGMREVRRVAGKVESLESLAPPSEPHRPEATLVPSSEPKGVPTAEREEDPGLKPPEAGAPETWDRTEAPSDPRPGSVEPPGSDPGLMAREAHQPVRPTVQRQPVEEALLPEARPIPAPEPEPESPQQPLPRAEAPPLQRRPDEQDQPAPGSGAEKPPLPGAREELPREPAQVKGVLPAKVAWEAPFPPEEIPPSAVGEEPGEASLGTHLPAQVQQADRQTLEPRQPTVQRQPLTGHQPAPPPEKAHLPLSLEDAEPVPPATGAELPPVEPQTGLEERILARADAVARLPLTSPRTALARMPEESTGPGTAPAAPGPAPRLRPKEQTAILTQARIQARVEEEPTRPGDRAGVGEPVPRLQARPAPRGRPALTLRQPTPAIDVAADVGRGWTERGREMLPLPPVVRPAPADQVQRLPLATPAEPVVQRSGESEERAEGSEWVSEGAPAEKRQKVDLDKLARDVYPLVKRMLAIERERIWGR